MCHDLVLRQAQDEVYWRCCGARLWRWGFAAPISSASKRGSPIIDTPLSKPDQFFATLQAAFDDGSLVKLALRAYVGDHESLKSVDIKPALIKRVKQLSFTWHYKTRDIVKNHVWDEAIETLRGIVGIEFNLAQLFTTAADWSLDFQGKAPRLKQSPPSQSATASL